ncbi:MAG: hypothetical protein A3A24_03070 [Candidatus Buchananbacteria bacterium RIFCSPLOWO2_01_FULL_46_12]|uniref:Uncharacterized protein n=2 Tax=Candidatus Buchananiibacteriota TaxID=1817903 RepID=A0A1G1YQW7_9BACT|nr:MAG: hypothetical protein A2744_02730 [Candidatus Buchananbacteria bacterium RIFCSPHIGHO2_01_FULL_44_11]OGY54020.1 MAG: hypothetical protein A3A24_03070 [Candidatus Buchananbacteria bacterium RIFCSPLOWO2_01_FULL_46_12]
MLKEKKISKKKMIWLSLIMLAVVVLIAYLLYGSFLASPGAASPGADRSADVLLVPSLRLDFVDDFIKKSPYKDLKENGNFPIIPDPVGRKNPFSEILFSFIR